MKADPFAALLGTRPAQPKKQARISEMSKGELHEFRKAYGRKGGKSTARDREHMADLGRLGGAAKGAGRHAKQIKPE